jgi:polygalacturonase
MITYLCMQSISFSRVKNAQILGITSLNSKSFHTHVSSCENIKVRNLTVIAPGNSPNTDGMHVSRSNLVNISSSTIGTGDDCISIGQGTTQLSVTDVHCGPGHGFRYIYTYIVILFSKLWHYNCYENNIIEIYPPNCK